MLKETRIIPVYPENEEEIENVISVYKMFGWELVSNHVCEELDSKGDCFAAFNKLTFERDKEGKHYCDYVRLENNYNELQAQRAAWEMMGEKYSKDYVLRVIENQPKKPRFNGFLFTISLLGLIFPAFIYCHHYKLKKIAYQEELDNMTPQTDELRLLQHGISDVIAETRTLIR